MDDWQNEWSSECPLSKCAQFSGRYHQFPSQMVFHCNGTNAHLMAFRDDSPFQFSGSSGVGGRQKMQVFKVATVAGLTILSMNPDSEVNQMPPHRQTLNITNANTFRSHLQQTASRTVKIFAFDDPNQLFFTIFESLVLKSTDFLCMRFSPPLGQHFIERLV